MNIVGESYIISLLLYLFVKDSSVTYPADGRCGCLPDLQDM